MACASEFASSAPCPPEAMKRAARPPRSKTSRALSHLPARRGVTEPSGMSPAPWMMMKSKSRRLGMIR